MGMYTSLVGRLSNTMSKTPDEPISSTDAKILPVGASPFCVMPKPPDSSSRLNSPHAVSARPSNAVSFEAKFKSSTVYGTSPFVAL